MDPLSEAEAEFARWLELSDLGDAPDFDAWCAARPDTSAELRALHGRWSQLKAAIAALDGRSNERGADVVTLAGPDPPRGIGGEGSAVEQRARELVARLRRRSADEQRYHVQEEIGRGGWGVVRRAYDVELERTVALKVLRERGTPQAPSVARREPLARVARFLREAHVTARLDHPGVVPLHDLGLDADGNLFFAMRLVRGQPLHEIFRLAWAGQEGWTRVRLLGVVVKICDALAFAHASGVVHRDLKPSNVMVGRYGEVYVMDWGLAKLIGESDTASGFSSASGGEDPHSPLTGEQGLAFGSPPFMAPEQARGDHDAVGPSSDIYAVGAMLYHLLVQRPPYCAAGSDSTPRELVERIRSGPPEPLAPQVEGVPDELVAICEKAMRREALDRYASIEELRDDLTAFLELRVVKAYESGRWAELKKWVLRNKGLSAGVATAFVAISAGLVASLFFYVEAAESARIATRNAAEFEAFQVARDLSDEVDNLWPLTPRRIEDYRSWIARAESLQSGGRLGVASLADYRRTLEHLRDRARPRTVDELREDQASHPRFSELEDLRRQLRDRTHMLVVRGTLPPPPEEEGGSMVPPSTPAAQPETLKELQEWMEPLINPERNVFGGEKQGLVWARRAVELATGSQQSLARRYLACALFANGFDAEAMVEYDKAIELAPEEETRKLFTWEREGLRRLMEELGGESGLDALERLRQQVDALEHVASERRTWHFDSAEDTWRHGQLAGIVSGVEELFEPEQGLLRGTSNRHGWGVEHRLDQVLAIEGASQREDVQTAWLAVIEGIRDPLRSPHYGGLVIEPQWGLAPLGQDPRSLLWEFADLQTGEPPERDAEGLLALDESSGLVFVLVPGGSFLMGAQSADPSRANYCASAGPHEGPVHGVAVAAYFLSKYEMNQAQWHRLTNDYPSYYRPGFAIGPSRSTVLNPVEQVSYNDCLRVLDRHGMTLPTEAQWEYAARAGSDAPWFTGNDPRALWGFVNLADATSKAGGEQPGWKYEEWLEDGFVVTAPVGSFEPNTFGFHDMLGNVWEICLDGYGNYINGVLPGSGERAVYESASRVTRGGSFGSGVDGARVSFRSIDKADDTLDSMGVRPARVLDR